MTQTFLLLGFVVIGLIASTGQSQAADKHSQLTHLRRAALTERQLIPAGRMAVTETLGRYALYT